MADEIKIGQVWRDTYGETPSRKYPQRQHGTNKRMVRVVALEADDRWLVQLIVDGHGKPVENGRKTRVKTQTLVAGYELVSQPEVL